MRFASCLSCGRVFKSLHLSSIGRNRTMPIDVTKGLFKFLKGAEDVIAPAEGKTFDWNSAAEAVRDQLSEAMGSRHVAFLMGAGCSSFVVNDKQLGIDPM